MASRHGQKKVKEEAPELVKAREERESAILKDYLGLKETLKEVIDSQKRDNDALKVTTALLRKSPDYYTVWNVRRTILKEGFLDSADDDTANQIYTNELDFVQENLKLNPKSYWMWNHRRWCLEHMSQPRWDRELGMVNKFLEIDSRNFHGWDYRRYIIRQLDLVDKEASDNVLDRAQAEFDFTTSKIHKNFSNYSAWHNRSTLLGKLAEAMTEEEKQSIVDNEFDLVKNAIYTDPEDQSAWLYDLWLIGREQKSISVLGASVISFHPLEIVVAFDQTVKLRNAFTVSTRLEHVAVPLEGEWKATGSDASLGSVWIFQQAPGAVYGPTVEVLFFTEDVCAVRAGSTLQSAVCFELETLNQDLNEISGQLTRLVVGKNLMFDVTKRIGPVAGPDGTIETQPSSSKHLVTSLTSSESLEGRVELLQREIASVRELIEIEPDCKWPIQILSTLLSELRETVSIHSMQAKEIDDECIELQEKLISIDPLRQERYEDRRTQLVFDRETLSIIKDSKRFPEIEFAPEQPRGLDLTMRGLTHIPTSSYFIHLHSLNLDSNAIKSTRFLRNLLNVRRVNLSNNLIERLEGVQHAPSLEFLNLENNMIAKWEDVVAGFVFWREGKLARTGCSVKVLLGLNPVIENEGGENVLEQRWEDVGEVGIEIQWKSNELLLAEQEELEQQLQGAKDDGGEQGSFKMDGSRRVSTTVVEFAS
ncbi:geranylgeranyl transferase type-2 subunit alpha [Entomortierella parvispora]|uniref:Geranylgeranyl transferase type-2 subunit alpha n=1 Tax=Entomortierella parvispora TaxID=205924 RepID=A0A9P3HHB7_9FUNG|nr:geranylgeranyl transferase type-2 subunit alpha [Entomortierella parvispora]